MKNKNIDVIKKEYQFNNKKDFQIEKSDIPYNKGKMVVLFYPERKEKNKRDFSKFVIPTKKEKEIINVDKICYNV